MRVVVFGQALIHRPVAWRSDLRALTEGADAVICNFEGCLPPAGAWPMKTKTVHAAPPEALAMLRDLGVTHLSIANNHVWDYGHAGILSTRAAIIEAGLAPAGAGASRAEAAAPAIHGGVALLAVDAGPTPDWAIAGDGPGVNPLRLTRTLGLPPALIDTLTGIALTTGEAERRAKRQAIGYDLPDISASFYGLPVEPAATPVEIWRPDPGDLAALVAAIRAARAGARCLMVSLHYHHWAREWSQTPAWLTEVMEALVEAGADGIVCTGPPVAGEAVIDGGTVRAAGLGNLVFHTRRGATYDRLGIPVRRGQALVLQEGRWSARTIEIQD